MAEEARRYVEAQPPARLFAVAAMLSERARFELDEAIAWRMQTTAEDVLDL